MNRPKAIEILTDLDKRGDFAPGGDVKPAIRLGREALLVYQKSQEAGWYPPGYKLPGETDD